MLSHPSGGGHRCHRRWPPQKEEKRRLPVCYVRQGGRRESNPLTAVSLFGPLSAARTVLPNYRPVVRFFAMIHRRPTREPQTRYGIRAKCALSTSVYQPPRLSGPSKWEGKSGNTPVTARRPIQRAGDQARVGSGGYERSRSVNYADEEKVVLCNATVQSCGPGPLYSIVKSPCDPAALWGPPPDREGEV